jgi:zinc transport system permease protein
LEITHLSLQHALIGGVLGSIICGIIGIIVLEKRLVMMSGGIAHVSYGGIGLGLYAHFPPMLGAMVFAVGGSLGIGRLSRRQSEKSDVLIGIFWSVTMALGVLLTQLSDIDVDFDTYLFGDIFSVKTSTLWMIFSLAIIVIFIFTAFYHTIMAYLFDEEYAAVQGIHVKVLETVLFILLGLSTITILMMVGLVLTVGLYAAPPAIAKKLTRNFKKLVLLSVLLNLIFVIIGVGVAYALQIASGAAIIFIAGITYFIVAFIEYVKKRRTIIDTESLNA